MNAPTDKRATAISAAQWRQIVNSARDTAVISTDTGGRITSWNTGAANLLLWTEEEMLGETLDRLFTPEDRARGQLAKEMADARTLGRGGGEEGWRLRKDGTRFWAAGEMAPILEDDALIGYIKILRDRTEQRKAEETIREERAALAILNRAGSALALETDLQRLVQIVTDTGVELTAAEFGAFFYNVLNEAGESYMLYTLSGAPLEAFAKFPMPRNTQVFAPTFGGEGIVRCATAIMRRARACPRAICRFGATSPFPWSPTAEKSSADYSSAMRAPRFSPNIPNAVFWALRPKRPSQSITLG
jgi:PAS domain S-box-containing protein